jgi:hypothetical protein
VPFNPVRVPIALEDAGLSETVAAAVERRAAHTPLGEREGKQLDNRTWNAVQSGIGDRVRGQYARCAVNLRRGEYFSKGRFARGRWACHQHVVNGFQPTPGNCVHADCKPDFCRSRTSGIGVSA